MAATSILATGSTSASSSDTTFTSDTLVSLKSDSAAGAVVHIEVKDDLSAYVPLGRLDSQNPARILAPGTYRFRRPAGLNAGVFSA